MSRNRNRKMEEARALGFSSLEACETHQVWLARQRAIGEECRKAVERSRQDGTGIIDIRGIAQ